MSLTNAFINGTFTSAEQATLNVEDRGTLFGDGVYEFTRCYIDGHPFQLREHMQRFANSAAAIDLEIPYSKEEIKAIVQELLAKSGFKQASLYFQLTRGSYPRTHNFPKVIKPNFFIIARELDPEPSQVMSEGLKAIMLPDERWSRCDIKSLNLLPNIMAKEKAVRQGAYEAILYRDHGVTEATSSSVFSVFDNVLYTTPPGPWVLPGITSNTLLELAKEEGYSVEFAFIPKERLYEADELFITSSRYDIVPITQLDETVIGSGKPGSVTTALKKIFHQFALRA